MGLFDKMKAGIKSVTNRVTGDYGQVTLELDQESYGPGDTIRGKIHVSATDDLKVTKIVVVGEGLATARLSESDDYELYDELYDDLTRRECSHSDRTFSNTTEVASEMELKAGESRDYDFAIPLPKDLPASFEGKYIKNSYNVRVNVDVPWGVDLNKSVPFQFYSTCSNDSYSAGLQHGLLHANLSLSQTAITPGTALPFVLKLEPRDQVTVESITAKLISVESVPGRVGEETDDEDRRDRDDDSNDPNSNSGPNIVWQEQQIELLNKEYQQTVRGRQSLSGSQTINESFQVPGDLPASFQHGSMSHRVLFEVVLEFEDESTAEFQHTLMVTRGPIQYQGYPPMG